MKLQRIYIPTLRKIKNDGFKKIAVETIPNKGLGKTINDRLKESL